MAFKKRITTRKRIVSVAPSISPALFAIYMDELLVELRGLGVGCYVADLFMGAFGYCDDIILLSPTRHGMQLMLECCERFATRNNLLFSTDPDPKKSKSKCLYLRGKRKNLIPPEDLQLYGVNLPWEDSATHLGHELTSEASMETDARMKRATFISRSTEVRETFQFARPTEVLNAVMLYCCDYYGSMLWDFRGEAATMFFNSMKTCVKLAYHVPRQTRTFIVNHLLARDLVSAREEIMSRFTGFVNKLASSPCREVRVMAALTIHVEESGIGKSNNSSV